MAGLTCRRQMPPNITYIWAHTMEGVRTFLDSSTVHGLGYISTTRRLIRLFWIVVVIGGFTGAGILIYQSFESWDESPIKTTTEVRSMKDFIFPKITVCPPANTFTDLNYDLVMTENMTLDTETKEELKNFALEQINDQMFKSLMANLSMLEDANRYYNWYHGRTEITLPRRDENIFEVKTFAMHGTISTKNFGKTFDAEKVQKETEKVQKLSVKIYTPNSLRYNLNATLHIQIHLEAMGEGKDMFSFNDDMMITKFIAKNYTPSDMHHTFEYYHFVVIPEDVRKLMVDMEKMPGFKVNWYYSGLEVKMLH